MNNQTPVKTMREAFAKWRAKQPGHPMAFYDERLQAFQSGWYARNAEIAQLEQREAAARKILEPMHDCDPDIREWLGLPRWGTYSGVDIVNRRVDKALEGYSRAFKVRDDLKRLEAEEQRQREKLARDRFFRAPVPEKDDG